MIKMDSFIKKLSIWYFIQLINEISVQNAELKQMSKFVLTLCQNTDIISLMTEFCNKGESVCLRVHPS